MDELKKVLKEKTLVFGTKVTLRNLKQEKTKHVLLSANCPKVLADEIQRLAKMAGAEVTMLDIPDKEIGLVCKKRFAISVLSY